MLIGRLLPSCFSDGVGRVGYVVPVEESMQLPVLTVLRPNKYWMILG